MSLISLSCIIQTLLFGSVFAEDCLTANNEKCKFPFTYDGVKYNECIPYQDFFWCSLYKKQVGKPGTWGVCDPKSCQPTKDSYSPEKGDCVTVDNRKCHFPFEYEGRTFEKCGKWGQRYWCSYTPEYNRGHWGYCEEATCDGKLYGETPEIETGTCVTVIRNAGQKCIFPFKYLGEEHNECLDWKGRYWCSLETEYKNNHWGYCDEALCPPTHGQAECPFPVEGGQPNDKIAENAKHIVNLLGSDKEMKVEETMTFHYSKKGWIRMYRRMSLGEAEGLQKTGQLSLRSNDGELWLSSSLKHSRDFDNQGVTDNKKDVVAVFQVDINCFVKTFKNDENVIPQEGSKEINTKGLHIENMKCLVHHELLGDHRWGKANFCLKGRANVEKFNSCFTKPKWLNLRFEKQEDGEKDKVFVYDPQTYEDVNSSEENASP